jgi:hypothetical protein
MRTDPLGGRSSSTLTLLVVVQTRVDVRRHGGQDLPHRPPHEADARRVSGAGVWARRQRTATTSAPRRSALFVHQRLGPAHDTEALAPVDEPGCETTKLAVLAGWRMTSVARRFFDHTGARRTFESAGATGGAAPMASPRQTPKLVTATLPTDRAPHVRGYRIG